MTDTTLPRQNDSWPRREDYRASFRTAWPLGMSFLGTIAISTTDILFMGRLGAEYLAAGSIAIAVYLVIFLVCLGMVLPAGPLASQARGRGDAREIRRVIRIGLWITVTVSVPGLVALWFLPDILRLAGQQEELIGLAERYMRVFMWVLMPAVGYAALRCFLTALERTRAVMIIMWLSVGLNAILDYLLVFGHYGFPEMGIEGLGLASVLVNCFMLIAIIIVVRFMRPFRRFGIFARLWKPDWQIYRKFLKMGWPISLELLTEEGLISAGTLLVGLLGTREVAAHAIALQWASIAYMIALGLSAAASARVGFFFGRRDLGGIKRSCYATMIMAVAFMSAVAVCFYLWPTELAVVFLDPDTENAGEVLALATVLIAIAAVFQISDGAQLVMSGALNGLSDMLAASIIGLCCYWGLGISAALLFGFYLGHGAVGIWWGMALGLVSAAVIYMIRFQYLCRGNRLLK